MAEAPKSVSCVTDVEDRDKLLAERMLQEPSCMTSSRCCIYRVPKPLLCISEEMYVPRIISIGPNHHGKETLGAGEEYKLLHLKSFIGRNPKRTLSDYVNSIREIEIKARECYEEEINLDSDEFVRMMILDGSFILELLLKFEVESNDCLFNHTLAAPSLRRDMCLLDNQIPFFVLDCLYNLSHCSKQKPPLIKLALDFFDPILPIIMINKIYPVQAKHLLDLLRNYLVQPFKPIEFRDNTIWEYTSCATSLQGAGVEFKRKDTAQCLLDITFTEDGKFEMPPFSFGESWDVLFPNLIALEQCRRDYPDMITSYVLLVNKLINSQKDVKLLSNKGIIEGLFIKDEKVIEIVDNLCQEVVVDKFYYEGLYGRINAYGRTPWNKWRATLMHNHFSASWADISYGAAVMSAVLVMAQTFLLLRTCT